MAIQVSGTQVISNSRGLTNIASVDATTVAALGAAGVGGGGPPAFDPTSTPNLTFTSSTTWTVPDLSSYSWVVFYIVAGGGSGSVDGTWANSGGGGAAYLVALTPDSLPSSIPIVIGAGGANVTNSGGNTGGLSSINMGVTVFTTTGGRGGTGTNDQNAGPPGTVLMPQGGTLYSFSSADANGGNSGGRDGLSGYPNGSTLGGAGGSGGRSGTLNAGGVSTYAGDGGDGGAGGSNGSAAGHAPGGGGGGTKTTSNGGNAGGNGSLRIYYY